VSKGSVPAGARETDRGLISLKTVYNNLDPEITNFVDVPVGYDADARRAARRRVALAGYRLADELKRLFERTD